MIDTGIAFVKLLENSDSHKCFLCKMFSIFRERESAREKSSIIKNYGIRLFLHPVWIQVTSHLKWKKTLWMELIEATTKKHRFMHCSSWLISFIWPCAKFGSTVHRDINIHYYPPSKVRTKCRKVYTFIFCVCMCVCACRI